MTKREANETVWFFGWTHAWYLGQSPYHAYGSPGKTKCGLDALHRHKNFHAFRRLIAEMLGRPCKRCFG